LATNRDATGVRLDGVPGMVVASGRPAAAGSRGAASVADSVPVTST
jgi:hypothetical protein